MGFLKPLAEVIDRTAKTVRTQTLAAVYMSGELTVEEADAIAAAAETAVREGMTAYLDPPAEPLMAPRGWDHL
jgi:hypothetical protein